MKKVTIITCLFVCICMYAISQTLNSITPNQGYAGQQNLTTTISGSALFVQTSSPSGNIYRIWLNQSGGSTINIFTWSINPSSYNVLVLDPDNTETHFNISSSVSTGTYDLHVIVGDSLDPSFNQIFYDLNSSFIVNPPDGYITGSVYVDANLNGIKDAGEQPVSNQTIRIMPDSAIVTTDILGNYTVAISNGNHDVEWLPSNSNFFLLSSAQQTYSVTVNNNTISGNNFGLKRGLINMVPNQAFQGQSINATISARGIFNTSGPQQGNVTQISLYRPGSTIIASFPAITVVDSNTVTCTFNIPGGATIAGYELDITTDLNRYHKLPSAFAVSPFPAYISGNIYFDTNQNGVKDAGEPNLANKRVFLTPDSVYGYTDVQGNYSVGTFNGTRTVTWDSIPGNHLLLSSSPASYTLNITGSVSGNDFGLKSDYPDYTSDIILASGVPRCNQSVTYIITYKNLGSISTNGQVYVVKDPSMLYNGASVIPSAVSGDTLFWNYSNLLTFQPATINVYFILPGGGSFITTKAYITAVDGGNNIQFTDDYILPQTVACSFDPNDKEVTPIGVLSQHYTLMTDTLEYLIRFQNTGNDTAFKVVVYDLLDNNFEYNTFQVLASSHPVTTELMNTGEVKFTFNNILLPDSNVNEIASHGYVRFSVQAKTGLPNYTAVYNTAYIAFDFNPAVVTNATFNTLVYTIPTAVSEISRPVKGAMLYPNPFDNAAKLIYDNPNRDQFSLTIADVNGRVTDQMIDKSGEIYLKKNNLKPGMYFYELNNSDHTIYYRGKFIIR